MDGRQARVGRRQVPLEDRNGALEERLGLGEAAGRLVEVGEVVERVWAKWRLPATVERFVAKAEPGGTAGRLWSPCPVYPHHRGGELRANFVLGRKRAEKAAPVSSPAGRTASGEQLMRH